ncbi:MAG: hypothetical protein JJT81_08605 [Rubellimicrobium sp.]|nr:hypothetical protein [Rubellimicrobium sp.]
MPAAAVAQGAQTFALPAGCEAFVTNQQASCTVSHHFTCEGDPEGIQRRVDLDEDGVIYYGAIDHETQWIESYHPLTGHSEFLMPEPARPASLSELIGTGVNEYDFLTTSPEFGTTRYVGTDRLTGETMTISGVTLDRTEYEITAYDSSGNQIWSSSGREFISRDWRMFIGGESRIVTAEDSWESDDTPVEFLFPGDPGFLSARPKYGCGLMMSALPPTTILPATQAKETADDAI